MNVENRVYPDKGQIEELMRPGPPRRIARSPASSFPGT